MRNIVDYEDLGAFYLGREVDGEELAAGDQPLLYDSSDLTTHAVIVGMTGSGKTGLGIDLIEEAALDGLPVLAIDPKGDLGNLALTFPSLSPEDFEPWVDAREAEKSGIDLSTYAAQVADQWREGLASWDQDGDRIARLREAAGVTIYTPGSTAGRPLSILNSFASPPAELLADTDLLAERLGSTATGLLTLLAEDTDPLGRQHILLSTILEHSWRQGRDLGIAELIAAVQRPPFDKIGVMSLETVFPAKDRMKLAMALNNLLAATGFDVWMSGDPLDIQSLLYEANGKPRIAVISLNHLSDAERMFFLTLLLTEVVAWTRAQSGTSSLRALVYIDELLGLLPPVAEPPTKKPLLTLLKQARAFGVGLALSTQNPIDLDYKALSNAGSWFIGRLQTERDVNRLLDGLASSDGSANGAQLAEIIAKLPKRTFVLHNVHEAQPTVFQTRWAMSYLAGPLTRQEIRRLNTADTAVEGTDRVVQASQVTNGNNRSRQAGAAGGAGSSAPVVIPPVLPPEVPQAFARAPGASATATSSASASTYAPFVLAIADVHYSSKTHGVEVSKRVSRLLEPQAGANAFDWTVSETSQLEFEQLAKIPEPGVGFTELPSGTYDAATVRSWSDDFARWLRTDGALHLWRSDEQKLTSQPEEAEREFRLRCAQIARESRDEQKRVIRERYRTKLGVIERRVLREEQAVGREQQQLQHRAVDTVGSIVGTLFGSGRRSSALSSLLKKASSGSKDLGDVQRAKERLAVAEADLAELEAELATKLAELDSLNVHPEQLALSTILIKPTSRNIAIRYLGLAWIERPAADDG